MYILAFTAKRKNARRHIEEKSNNLDALRAIANNINKDRYVVEIYNGKWELVERF